MNSIAWIVEIVSSSFNISKFWIGEVEALHVIDGVASRGAGTIKVGSWDIWEDDRVLVSGEDAIDFRLGTGKDKLSTLAPVLNWSPLWVDEKMLGNSD